MTRLTSLAGAAASAAAAIGLSPLIASDTVKGPPRSNSAAGLAVPLWTPGQSPTAGRSLRFESVPRYFGKARIQLSGGRGVINANDWRAVAISKNIDGEKCTLTLVGPTVVLLAAHCVDSGLAPGAAGKATIPASVIFRSNSYDLDCELPQTYSSRPVNPTGAPRATDDFALCDVSPRVTEISAETLSREILLPKGAAVQLMGYGCTDLGLSEDDRYTFKPSKGVLNMGPETIDDVDQSIYSNEQGTYVRTRSETRQDPVLCYGDSGGPVIVAARSGPGRRVVAVNSAMGATPDATSARPTFYSYLAPLASTGFRSFVEEWVAQGDQPDLSKRKDRRICGINISAGLAGCRP